MSDPCWQLAPAETAGQAAAGHRQGAEPQAHQQHAALPPNLQQQQQRASHPSNQQPPPEAPPQQQHAAPPPNQQQAQAQPEQPDGGGGGRRGGGEGAADVVPAAAAAGGGVNAVPAGGEEDGDVVIAGGHGGAVDQPRSLAQLCEESTPLEQRVRMVRQHCVLVGLACACLLLCAPGEAAPKPPCVVLSTMHFAAACSVRAPPVFGVFNARPRPMLARRKPEQCTVSPPTRCAPCSAWAANWATCSCWEKHSCRPGLQRWGTHGHVVHSLAQALA